MDDEAASLDAYLFHRHLRPSEEPPPTEVIDHGTDVEIRAVDGVPLAATWWEGARDQDHRRAVVIASATGVRREYYARFASWLASRGFDVVTFDYRGIGGSPGAADATMHAWGEQDLAGVVTWADRRAHDVAVVGHSVGGQLLGLLPHPERLRAVVTVASQSGDWRLWPMPYRLAMAALWYGIVPTITHTVGFLPGSFGIGEDLPAGVALEWARWCRTPDYLVGDDMNRRDGFAQLRAPVLAYSFAEDVYAPKIAVDALVGLFANALVDRRHVTDQHGIGHFGFFRSRRQSLWKDIEAFLDRTMAR